MGWLRQTSDSSIGGKAIVAVTGLLMVGFIVAHLSGNLLVFGGPDALNSYAKGLREFPKLLWTARIGLVVAALLHIVFAIRLNIKNQAARPVKYVRKVFTKATWTSRTMVYTGLLILFYVLFHLAEFTWRVGTPASLGPFEIYDMVVGAFQNPLISGLYILAMIVLGLHLSHGISSFWQSLGWKHPKYDRFLNGLGPVLGTLLALGYISIPVSVLLGILK